MSDSDYTLPTIDVVLDELGSRKELVLTIIYHPDMSRIGERSVVDASSGPQILGRNSPEFGRHCERSRPLGDRHISRRAVAINSGGKSVSLHRSEDSCRCRVAGLELSTERELDAEALVPGVTIQLAHSVVLLLTLSAPLDGPDPPDYGLLGSSVCMRELRRQIHGVAAADLDVLLRGETGTGKEVVANALHQASERRGQPMVTVNVAAIPGSLAPAALFGSARGAFTGADRPGLGYFQQARGGTLFLDEIGDAAEEVQPQLLRALQQGEIQPVGGRIENVDVRVISATDADIEGETANFKSALRHRLGSLEINLPPLRAHREDIGELLHHYLVDAFSSLGRPDRLPGENDPAREVAACALLFHEAVSYHWPGNVRQLINVCNQVAVASDEELCIPPSLAAMFCSRQTASRDEDSRDGAAHSRHRQMREISDDEFDRAMHDCYHEVAGVAQHLGVSRQSVYRRMASSGIYRKAVDLPEPELRDAVRECRGDTLAAARLLRVSASGLRSRLRTGTGDSARR